jgi:two-component sensor histidine kinase
MEKLLNWLPVKPQPVLVRYGFTTALVGLCFILLLAVQQVTKLSCFFLMYPAVFLGAVLFDRGSGFLATLLSTGLLLAMSYDKSTVPESYWLPLVLFLLVGFLIAGLSEMLRQGWERAIDAERIKDVLYRELGHRTKNDFALAGSVLMLQARSQSDATVREALLAAVGRLTALGRAQEHFDPAGAGDSVPMRDYLQRLCHRIDEIAGDRGTVSVRVTCDDIALPSGRAVPVGLIVNELLTNAFKHAFSEEEPGEVEVSFLRRDGYALIVEDNGRGCPEGNADGVGSTIVSLLAKQLNGSMERVSAGPGCRVRVLFPETLS